MASLSDGSLDLCSDFFPGGCDTFLSDVYRYDQSERQYTLQFDSFYELVKDSHIDPTLVGFASNTLPGYPGWCEVLNDSTGLSDVIESMLHSTLSNRSKANDFVFRQHRTAECYVCRGDRPLDSDNTVAIEQIRNRRNCVKVPCVATASIMQEQLYYTADGNLMRSNAPTMSTNLTHLVTWGADTRPISVCAPLGLMPLAVAQPWQIKVETVYHVLRLSFLITECLRTHVFCVKMGRAGEFENRAVYVRKADDSDVRKDSDSALDKGVNFTIGVYSGHNGLYAVGHDRFVYLDHQHTYGSNRIMHFAVGDFVTFRVSAYNHTCTLRAADSDTHAPFVANNGQTSGNIYFTVTHAGYYTLEDYYIVVHADSADMPDLRPQPILTDYIHQTHPSIMHDPDTTQRVRIVSVDGSQRTHTCESDNTECLNNISPDRVMQLLVDNEGVQEWMTLHESPVDFDENDTNASDGKEWFLVNTNFNLVSVTAMDSCIPTTYANGAVRLDRHPELIPTITTNCLAVDGDNVLTAEHDYDLKLSSDPFCYQVNHHAENRDVAQLQIEPRDANDFFVVDGSLCMTIDLMLTPVLGQSSSRSEAALLTMTNKEHHSLSPYLQISYGVDQIDGDGTLFIRAHLWMNDHFNYHNIITHDADDEPIVEGQRYRYRVVFDHRDLTGIHDDEVESSGQHIRVYLTTTDQFGAPVLQDVIPIETPYIDDTGTAVRRTDEYAQNYCPEDGR